MCPSNYMKMYHLVTNIPEEFRTPDLRNFFAEVIEEAAFNCFHFRHRPHQNFVQLLPRAYQNNSDHGSNSVRERKYSCSHRPTVDDSSEIIDLGVICELCRENPLCVKARTENRKQKENDKYGSSFDYRPSVAVVPNQIESEGITNRNSLCECKCHKSLSSNIGLSDESEYEMGLCVNGGKPKSSTKEGRPTQSQSQHWLSSGLSGLTSLIQEKKQKTVKSSFKENINVKKAKEESLTFQNQELVRDDVTVPSTHNQIKNINKASTNNLMLGSASGTCCLVDVKEDYTEKFCSLYHKKYWIDRNGDALDRQCLIINMNLDYISNPVDLEKDYLTRGDTEVLHSHLTDVKNMIEFHPPSIMPQGNVGTPTCHFKQLVRSCQLPGTIIAKLGLRFPRTRGKKRFGQVPFDYGTKIYSASTDNQEKLVTFTAAGHLIPASVDFTQLMTKSRRKSKKLSPKLELEKESEDGAEVEEWERYEAFHNDVTSQDRTKERLYEKEIELVWEKGGPGLVFYTDAQYWRQQEGDFDEQTADEWDVDTSIYYEKGAGDYDAHDSVGMLESNDLRSGALMQSAFNSTKKQINATHRKVNQKEDSKKRRKIGPAAPPKIGNFEAHTRGFGRRLLESQGWTDGLGLGRQSAGLPYALDNDGQHPHDKKGFGYHGEKFQGWGKSSTSSSRQQSHCSSMEQDCDSGIRISTVFDSPRDIDPPAPHLRASEPTRLSHRQQNIPFSKASDPEAF